MSPVPARWRCLPLLLLLFCGCTLDSYHVVDRRKPDPAHYEHERQYIQLRRTAAKLGPSRKLAEGDQIVGLALSGGGLRSATFNLGVLQALEAANVLKEVDYLSTVSGGSYIGSWYVSHLRLPGQPDRFDENGILVESSDPRKLLLDPSAPSAESWSDADPVEHLQNNASFLVQGGWGWPKLIGTWAVKMVPNLVFDVILHFKPSRGKGNFHTNFYSYRKRIRDTYLHTPCPEHVNIKKCECKKEKEYFLEEIHPDGSTAPYLIINATLGNYAACRSAEDYPVRKDPPMVYYRSPFEFTRDYCGANGLGFVQTKGFDQPVWDVDFKDGVAERVTVRRHNLPWVDERKKFALSTAVATSGAAVDSAGVPDFVNVLADLGLRAVNLNLRYEARNFSQSLSQLYWWPVDRILREMIWDRFFPTIRSNSLQLSDGGHYENLGIVALARRMVPVILSVDASADPEYQYRSLLDCIEVARWEGCSVDCDGFEICFPDNFPDAWIGQRPPHHVMSGTISCGCVNGLQSELYYLKAQCGKNDSGYDDFPRFVKVFKESSPEFPHKSTIIQWYDWYRFEAYRQLGRHLGDQLRKTVEETPLD